MMKILTKEQYDKFPIYEHDDLGAVYSKERTVFKLWAPSSRAVSILLYKDGLEGNYFEKHKLYIDEHGVWSISIEKDLLGVFYTYEVEFEDSVNEAVDPYAKAVGVNGQRAMVIDLSLTDIEKWENDGNLFVENQVDAVIYEMHVRDMTIDELSGVKNKGKYTGLVEKATHTVNGTPTALAHLIDLGITHVHLLPVFDYYTVDESKPEILQFNWGYDPLNYNVPEGSYATNPYDGFTRIKEFKRMVKGLHDNGIGVIMDVVYNHTGVVENSWFNLIVPGYYYRHHDDGTFSNGSGCNNETASERYMVRKYIVDSLKYWAKEYHIDGFRFDLMAVHDIETMNIIRSELDKIDKRIIMYGEGWNGGESTLGEERAAFKRNAKKFNERIAVFSDDLRDAIKGDVFINSSTGFVNGGMGLEETIKFGVVASTFHPQIDYSKINYSKEPWAKEPTQTVNYVSDHDNLTLWDKLCATCPNATKEELIKMDKLSNGIVLTCQGISFLHEGEEFLRTKGGEHNSFKSSDSINKIYWKRKEEYLDVYNYYKGLIELRKSHRGFRLTTQREISNTIRFIDTDKSNLVAFEIKGCESYPNTVVIYNGSRDHARITLSSASWKVVVDDKNAGVKGLWYLEGNNVVVEPISMVVLVK